MTLKEIGYMVLESIKSNHITDDEEISKRLLYKWIDLKRASFIKNKSNSRININNLQSLSFEVTKQDSYKTVEKTGYPYISTDIQKYSIYKSNVEIPSIVESKSGPIILNLTSSDLMKLPYQVVPYSYLLFTGNSRFNKPLIYGALKDNYLYLQQNNASDYLTDDSECIITAVFNNPREVESLTEDDEYPCSLDVIESIKNSIFNIEFKMFLNSKEDNENSANDEL